MAGWDVAKMCAIGVRFGKGLQLTNIVKDIARDLHHGRCYVPESLLQEAGLKPADLLDEANLPRFRPVLNRLIGLAMEHLDRRLDLYHVDSSSPRFASGWRACGPYYWRAKP